MDAIPETIHATCIALSGRGVLLRGPPGSGKSDLALRCLGLGPNPLLQATARLIADDRVVLRREGHQLLASAPRSTVGKLEVRGIGILEVPADRGARVVLAVDLHPRQSIERLPDRLPEEAILGVPIPVLRMEAFAAAAAFKLLLAIVTHGVATLP